MNPLCPGDRPVAPKACNGSAGAVETRRTSKPSSVFLRELLTPRVPSPSSLLVFSCFHCKGQRGEEARASPTRAWAGVPALFLLRSRPASPLDAGDQVPRALSTFQAPRECFHFFRNQNTKGTFRLKKKCYNTPVQSLVSWPMLLMEEGDHEGKSA